VLGLIGVLCKKTPHHAKYAKSKRKQQQSINQSELQIRFEKLTSIDTNYIISSPNPMFGHLLKSS